MLEQHEMNLKRMMGVGVAESLPENVIQLMTSIEEMATAKDGEAIMISGQTLLMVAAIGKLFYGVDDVRQLPVGELVVKDEDVSTSIAIPKAIAEPVEPDRLCIVEVGKLSLEGVALSKSTNGNTMVMLEVPDDLVAYFDDEDITEPEKEKSNFKRQSREHEPQKCEVFWEGTVHKAVIQDEAETEAGMVSVLMEGETEPTLISETNVKFPTDDDEKEEVKEE